MTVQKQDSSNKRFTYLAILVGAIGANYGINYGLGKMLGDSRVYDKEQPHFEIPELFSEEEVQSLREYVLKHNRFVTGKEAFSAGVEDNGEGIPVDENGDCPADRDLFNTGNGLCVTLGRMDIAQHFFKTGGTTGAKEFFNKLQSSVYAFYKVLPIEFIKEEPMFQDMFKKPEYQKAMATLCQSQEKSGQDESYFFRPLQVNIVVIPPGQDLPMHYDNGWFWGANRFTMPDYLTVAMTQSHLFDDIMIPQAQSVVYLHGSAEDKTFKHGGEYIFYPNGPGGARQSIPIMRGHGVIMNGGLIPHGGRRVAESYKAKNFGENTRDGFQRLEYQGNNTWYLMVNDDIVDHFQTDDLRLSFVWRGLCFNNEEEANSYESYPAIDLEEIRLTFEKDLRKRGVLKGPRPEPEAFNMMIINEYTRMPAHNLHGTMPFNYCILAKLYPSLKPFLTPFCTDVDPYKALNNQLPKPKPICEGRMFTSPDLCENNALNNTSITQVKLL